MEGMPVPVLVTEKPGPGVAVATGIGDGSGELCGIAAGEMAITSVEIIEELGGELGAFNMLVEI
jgi:hypothetical protein